MSDEHKEDINSIDFNFTWKALELLGKSLYSNAWSAISELVANGLDAGSDDIYVYLDVSNKTASFIEITDGGSGMRQEDMRTYAKIGYDKRASIDNDSSDTVMGRKGIGKLAALFLSNNYYIQTKTEEGTTTWGLNIEIDDPDSVPKIIKVPDELGIITPIWEDMHTGTLLRLNNVDLTGFGNAAFKALGNRLANQFQLSSMPNKHIYLAVNEGKEEPDFKDVEKNVAYKNMLNIAFFYSSQEHIPHEIQEISNNESKVKVKLSRNNDIVKEVKVEVDSLANLQSDEDPIVGIYLSSDGKEYPYTLEGWIGTHATIENEVASKNDKRFEKNRFYNPSQIRLYVRNKLACEDLLSQLGLTQTYANYIEGEIHFDLLDINELPDIATSNRQNFAESDDRWQLLKRILRPIVRAMITRRTKRISELKKEEEKKELNRKGRAKAAATSNIVKELDKVEGISDTDRNDLSTIVAAQYEGNPNLSAKEEYKIFISHKSEDSFIADFFYYFLLNRGARKEEFFYTSDKSSIDYSNLESISEQIKKNIIDTNTLVVFFTSPYFLQSQYCLFEGGAVWATRAIGEYPILTTVYAGIPEYLTNGKFEHDLSAEGKIELNTSNYNGAVRILNIMIDHINKGRDIKEKPLLDMLEIVDFPDKVKLEELGQSIQDYMDTDIVKHWDKYIGEGIKNYKIIPEKEDEDKSDRK